MKFFGDGRRMQVKGAMLKKLMISMFLWELMTGNSFALAQKAPAHLAAWTGFELYLPFREQGKWGLLLENYTKGNRFLAELQGAFYRVGVNYYTRNGNRLGAGYGYQWNVPYDEVSLPYPSPDYRIYEQFVWKLPSADGNSVWTQRFRLEQRWLGRKNGPDYDDETFDYYKFENTFRYQLRYQWWFKARWAMVLNDEVHIRTTAGKDLENFFDQNRLYLGGAYALNLKRELRIEVGYMNQSYWKSADTEAGRSRINHTIRMTLTGDLPFKR